MSITDKARSAYHPKLVSNLVQHGPPVLRLTKIINLSQVITMMPIEAESYDWPALMAGECQRVADYYQRMVSFSGRESGDRHTFVPTPDNP